MLKEKDIETLLKKLFLNAPQYLAVTQVIDIPPPFVSSSVLKDLRKSFSISSKPAFLQWLATNQPDQIQDILKIDRSVVKQMQTLPLRDVHPFPTKIARYTVDHIIPLSCGGDNVPDNFSLIPKKLNEVKAVFESAQIELPQTAELQMVTLAPLHTADGTFSKIIPSLDP